MAYKWLVSDKIKGGSGATLTGGGADADEAAGLATYGEYSLAHKKLGDGTEAQCGWFVGPTANSVFNANPLAFECPPQPAWVKDPAPGTVQPSLWSRISGLPTKTKVVGGVVIVGLGYFLLKKKGR